MSVTTEYITLPGDRWDLIAYKAYGTFGLITLSDGTQLNAMSFLIASNPDILIDNQLMGGVLLQIPIIPSSSVKTDSSLLPPWKR